MIVPAMTIGKRGFRYAQEKGGQKLHIVEVYMDGSVDRRAACGRTADWRKTFNMPLAHSCGNCRRYFR